MHTPGPWMTEPTTLSICRLIVTVEDVTAIQVSPVAKPQYVIAYVPDEYSRETQEANARLIAAAPDLLDAMQTLYSVPGVRRLLAPVESLDSIAAKVEAAITKASVLSGRRS